VLFYQTGPFWWVAYWCLLVGVAWPWCFKHVLNQGLKIGGNVICAANETQLPFVPHLRHKWLLCHICDRHQSHWCHICDTSLICVAYVTSKSFVFLQIRSGSHMWLQTIWSPNLVVKRHFCWSPVNNKWTSNICLSNPQPCYCKTIETLSHMVSWMAWLKDGHHNGKRHWWLQCRWGHQGQAGRQITDRCIQCINLHT
jgi:hypothetical protein